MCVCVCGVWRSPQILFASSQPKQSANLSLAYLWERITDTKIISLDTTPPHVDPAVGVYSTSPNQNYSAGKEGVI